MKKWIIAAIVLVIILAGVAVWFDAKQSKPAVQPVVPIPNYVEAPNQVYPTVGMDVLLTPAGFEPSVLSFPNGTELVLKVTATTNDVVVSLPAYGLSTTIASGQTGELKFTVLRQDLLEVLCTSGCRREHRLTINVQ